MDNIMKLKDLLNLMDGDTYIQLIDVESEQHIEAGAHNTLLQYFEEVKIKNIYTRGTLYLKIQK